MGLLIRWVTVLVVLTALVGHALWSRAHPEPPNFPELPVITQSINESLADNRMICVNTVPFPFDSSNPPEWRPGLPLSGKPMTCQNCDALVEVGLLSESPGARYELTALGRANYVDEIRNIDGLPAQTQARMEAAKHTPPTPADTSMPGFCFADKVVVHQIVAALAPTEVFRQRLLSVKYVAEAVNPSPFVFDPKFKLLHLPVPRTDPKAPGAPALYAPIIATYSKSLLSPSSPWSESSMRYGPWVNQ